MTVALQRPISISSTAVPLKQTLDHLSKSQRVAVVLDRRIDPNQRVEIDAANLPLKEVLDRIARQSNSQASYLPDVIYIGPAATAEKLRTILAMIDKNLATLSAEQRTVWRATAPLTWSDRSTPRRIAELLAAQGSIRLVGIEALPHDLWAGVSTPPLPLYVRLGLVLVQFDRTLAVSSDGQVAEIIPMPETVAIERRYPGGARARQKAEQWQQWLPSAKVEVHGNEIHVIGRVEDHERLQGRGPSAEAEPREPATLDQIRVERLVLEEVALGQVLESLSSRLGLHFHYDAQALESAGVRLEQPISVRVEKATIDELLAAALSPIGLTFKRAGRDVQVGPLKRDQ